MSTVVQETATALSGLLAPFLADRLVREPLAQRWAAQLDAAGVLRQDTEETSRG